MNGFCLFIVCAQEIATRKLPYEGAEDAVIIRSVEKGEREDIPADVAKPLAELIRRCWHQDPNQRPKMLAVVAALEALQPAASGVLPAAAGPGEKTQMIGQILE